MKIETAANLEPITRMKSGFSGIAPSQNARGFESLESAILACPTVAFVSIKKRRESLIQCGFDGTKPITTRLLKKLAVLQIFRKSVSRL